MYNILCNCPACTFKLFINSSHCSLTSSLQTAFTDYYLDRFFWTEQLVLFSGFLHFWYCALDYSDPRDYVHANISSGIVLWEICYLPHQRWWEVMFSRRRYVGRYIRLWTTSWRQFKSDCHQTLSVIPLATGDEVIKFLSAKGQGRCER